jgi:hypothetical protein
MPPLPQEIIDHIITELDDPCHLGSCALVSRSFRPQAQRLLFSHVVLNDYYPHKLTDLAQILARNPTLGSYVQQASLYLEGYPENSRQAAHDMQSILRACHIRELYLQMVKLKSVSMRMLSGKNLPHLKRFCALQVTLRPITTLRDLLSAFPSLDQLELRLDHLFTYEGTTSLEHRPVNVKRLHVSTHALPIPDLSRLALADLYAGIKELKLTIATNESTELVNEVLESCGADLDHFHLHEDIWRESLSKPSCLLFV